MGKEICKNCYRWIQQTTVCLLWHFPHAPEDSCRWFVPIPINDDEPTEPVLVQCKTCGGRGWVKSINDQTDSNICPVCNGTGLVSPKKEDTSY